MIRIGINGAQPWKVPAALLEFAMQAISSRTGGPMPIQPADVSRFLDRSGWSQARLAWTLGINQPRISRFLHGLKKPNQQLQSALETFFADDTVVRALGRAHGGLGAAEPNHGPRPGHS